MALQRINSSLIKQANGTTANRPSNPAVGTTYFDTTLGKPVWYKGSSVWVDATGATV